MKTISYRTKRGPGPIQATTATRSPRLPPSSRTITSQTIASSTNSSHLRQLHLLLSPVRRESSFLTIHHISRHKIHHIFASRQVSSLWTKPYRLSRQNIFVRSRPLSSPFIKTQFLILRLTSRQTNSQLPSRQQVSFHHTSRQKDPGNQQEESHRATR